MRGNKIVKKRDIQGDRIYGNRLVSRFINRSMRDGKKTTAENNVYQAFEIIKAKGQDPVQVFEQAINNVGPKLEVKARRVGGASYQIPIEVRGERRISLAIRWLLEAASKRSNKEYHTFGEKLATELMDAANNMGDAIKRRDTIARAAEANKAFSHFRW